MEEYVNGESSSMRKRWKLITAIPLMLCALLLISCGGREKEGTEGAAGTETAAEAETGETAGEEETPAPETEPPPPAEPPVPYAEEEVPVFRETATEETVVLRFYEDLPHVAYISFADYHHLFLPAARVTVEEQEPGSGLYDISTGTGEAVADIVGETIRTENLPGLTNVMGIQQPGMDNTYYDGVPYIRWASTDYSPEKAPVTLEFADYGIDVRAEEDALYFPLATLADIYSDLDYHTAFYNGEKVYIEDGNHLESPSSRDPEYPAAQFALTEWPADLADFTYRELCFAMDHFYGFPGRGTLEKAVAEKGLDQALRESGEEGAKTAELIQSARPGEYLAGMDALGYLMDDAGHTDLYLGERMEQYMPEEVKTDYEAAREALPEMQERIRMQEEFYGDLAMDNQARRDIRTWVCGADTTYYESGDTAVCFFDTFNPTDYGALGEYLAGETHIMPEAEDGDPIVILLDALNRASMNPEIRNFVIDISNNQGGSVDLTVAMESLLLGSEENGIPAENTFTGQRMDIRYDVDRNFNGEFDPADKDVRYDYRYAVLVSDSTFSCGSLFASLMRDHGVLLLGEPSGGGTCAVQNMATADGFIYRISSGRMRLVNEAGRLLEDGVPVDVNLVQTDSSGKKDYREFYNMERIGQEIEEYYSR